MSSVFALFYFFTHHLSVYFFTFLFRENWKNKTFSKFVCQNKTLVVLDWFCPCVVEKIVNLGKKI